MNPETRRIFEIISSSGAGIVHVSFVRVGGGLHLDNTLFCGPPFHTSPVFEMLAGLMNFNTQKLTKSVTTGIYL
jgi:hypothetical protein